MSLREGSMMCVVRLSAEREEPGEQKASCGGRAVTATARRRAAGRPVERAVLLSLLGPCRVKSPLTHTRRRSLDTHNSNHSQKPRAAGAPRSSPLSVSRAAPPRDRRSLLQRALAPSVTDQLLLPDSRAHAHASFLSERVTRGQPCWAAPRGRARPSRAPPPPLLCALSQQQQEQQQARAG